MVVGFIGVGNMGGSIARCLASSKSCDVVLSDHNLSKAQAIANEYSCRIMSNVDLIKSSDVVFLGIKPQMVDSFFEDEAIKESFTGNNNVVFVSMLAGVKLQKLIELSGLDNIVRIMPNTPIDKEEGFVSICSNNDDKASLVADILEPTGQVSIIDECLMDAATAVAGCGPAFVYEFIDALAQGGVDCGLEYDAAIKMAAQTVLGSAKMVHDSSKSAKQLCEDVCSPGGATIEGVNHLRENNLEDLVKQAVIKAYKKSQSLG